MVLNRAEWRRPVTISLPLEQVAELDRIRGGVPRSRWIGDLIDQAIESQLMREGERA